MLFVLAARARTLRHKHSHGVAAYNSHVLQRYLLREILTPYLLGTLLFIGLVTTDLLSSLSGVFLSRGTSWLQIAELVLYRMPYTLGVALPLGLVFAVLVALARWIRDSELKAVLAAGIAPVRLLAPVLGLAVLVALVAWWNAGWLKPEAQARYDDLIYKIYYGHAPSGVLANTAYAPEGLGVYYASRIYPEKDGRGKLEGVRVVTPEGAVWSADHGFWQGPNWILEDAWKTEPGHAPEHWDKMPLPFPSNFVEKKTGYESLPMPELRQLARVDPAARFPLQRRHADAVGVIALAWLAAVIGLSLRESAWAFAAVVLVIFAYYVFWTLAAQFARFEVIGPYGAWLADVIFFIAAAIGTRRLL